MRKKVSQALSTSPRKTIKSKAEKEEDARLADIRATKRLYKSIVNDQVMLHAAIVFDHQLRKLKSRKSYPINPMNIAILSYLATTPAASKKEIQTYLFIHFGYSFRVRGNQPEGDAHRFGLAQLYRNNFIQKVKMPKMHLKRPQTYYYQITPEGKEFIRPLIDGTVLRKIRQYTKYLDTRNARAQKSRKRTSINRYYPELKRWAKI